VLYRPKRVAEVLASVTQSQQQIPLRPLFMLSSGDMKELRAVSSTEADFAIMVVGRQPGDYARKINEAVTLTKEPWIFTGADDLAFRSGWAEAAIAFAEKKGVRAVGVNDLGRWATRRGDKPSPHFLVHRSYVEERGTADQPGLLFHEGYDHNYVDTEFLWTAVARGEYGHCADAVVEHLHPVWRKGRRDEVYTLGQRQARRDHRLFQNREKLWTT
jgi:hypothetical protein